ncbi:excinuclease ABC subunit UvrC [Arboricoccus pini]|uniref:excinuclease ABC subunit UvrC n=1 Tax=Arboricoccus pini TaxID=1963835 RepID=UPI002AC7F5DB|nr:excinuclease ABC subunit UvrC [Arboricoccus pini]
MNGRLRLANNRVMDTPTASPAGAGAAEETAAPLAAPSGIAPLKGAELIRSLVPRLPNAPGVYRMQDERGEVLYVGKAKSLKRRVPAYTKIGVLSARLQRMVALTRSMEFVTTASEVEALLLEANLIKRYRPTFNIVLRDDKSFPYIYLRYDHEWPMIGRQRGAKRAGRDYFGPFASSGAVNETLNALLRAFPLRSCPDSIFNVRSRPCLQYQIKRCSAPCVGRIDKESYAGLVVEVKEFLNGHTKDIQARLQEGMTAAAERMDYEAAAVYRDRLKAIAHVSSRQGINTDAVDDADIVAMHAEHGQACVQVFFYRGGRNYGNRAYYPGHTRDSTDAEVLAAFMAQFYSDRQPARLVLVSHDVAEQELLAEALAIRAGRKVEIAQPRRGDKRQLVEDALKNAREALARRMADTSAQEGLLEALAERIGLEAAPQRVEVYDNSHIQGTNAIGAFIVAGPEGFDRKSYRTFNIKGGLSSEALAEASEPLPASLPTFRAGDDFAMMREVLRRRFGRLIKEDPDRERAGWPDLVIIDGGAGQLGAAHEALDELGVRDVAILGVAKGPDRNAGRERFFMRGREAFSLDPRDPVLYFLQRLRDEAHRFAITTHRGRRAKAIGRSELDAVPGIGAKRKKALLQHFGSARGVSQAGLRDLEQVPGIDKAVARQVYDHFHDSR